MVGAIEGTESGESRRLILASRSPRRRQLLDEAGIAHTVRLAEEIDDGDLLPGRVPPENWVAALAYLKARAVADGLDDSAPGPVVLGADTVCVQDEEIIGQPADRADAARIIRLFENRAHEVMTGVALVECGGAIADLFVERASVRVGSIGDEAIESYLETGMWRGKAGAYNLFERLEAGWPIEFDGDGTTIVGLPMEALGKRLCELGFEGLGHSG
jgi:septum formation protein